MVLKQNNLKTSNKHQRYAKTNQIMPQTRVNVKCASFKDEAHIYTTKPK